MEVGGEEISGQTTNLDEGTNPGNDSGNPNGESVEERNNSQADGTEDTNKSDNTSSNSTERNPEEKLCGWLTQRTRGIGNLKLTRQRWFIFGDENCKLYFYRDPQDFVPLGEICIASASFYFDAGNTEKPGLFQIKSDGKEFLLDAGNRPNMMYWLQALQQKRKEYSLKRQSVGYLSQMRSSKLGGLISRTDQEECGSPVPASLSQESLPEILVSQSGNTGSSNNVNASSRSTIWALGNLKSEIQQVISGIKIPDTFKKQRHKKKRLAGKSSKDSHSQEESIFYAEIISDKNSLDTGTEFDSLSNVSSSSNQSSVSYQKSHNNHHSDNVQISCKEHSSPSDTVIEPDQTSSSSVRSDSDSGSAKLNAADVKSNRSIGSGSWIIISDSDHIIPEENQSGSKFSQDTRDRSLSDAENSKSQGKFLSTLKKIRKGKRVVSDPVSAATKNSIETTICPRCKMPVTPPTSSSPQGQGAVPGSLKTFEDLEEELKANREIVSILQTKLDESIKEIHSRQQSENASDREKTELLVEKDKHLLQLNQQLNVLKDQYRVTEEKLRSTEAELKTTQEQNAMYEDMLRAKDQVIMGLTNEIFEKDQGRQSSGSFDQPETMQSPVTRDSSGFSKSDKTVIQTYEREVEKLKDMCQGYELQHKFLTKEILELNELRKHDQAREKQVTMDFAKMQAKYYQVKSKYYVLLKQQKAARPPVRDSTEGGQSEEIVEQLLQDALESEAEAADELEYKLTSSGHEYDRYGFSRRNDFEHEDDDDEDLLGCRAVQLERQSQEINSKVKEAEDASWRVKWENFMVGRGSKVQRSQELKNLIRHGVPHEYREEVWKGCVSLYVSNTRDKLGGSYYHDVVHRRLQATTLDPAVKQIELDLLRTLPNNKHYATVDSEGIPRLRKVLLAFSEYNTTIGYCQGLNRLAAIALLFLSEEEAFWCLVAIVDHILPQDYFSQTLMAAQADQRVLKDVLHEKLPKVHAHLEQHGVDLSLFTFNWFLTVFVDNIPPETFLRVWDTFLYEGSKVLFRFAVAFMKMVEDDILKQQNSLELNRYLRRIGENMRDIRQISYIAFNWLNPFPMRLIAVKRQQHLEEIKVELAELEKMRYGVKMQREQLELTRDYCSDDDLDT